MSLVGGQEFAGFRIVRRLGAGGMGEVYLAQHPRLPRRDALKVMPAALSKDADYRARFEREADLASTLWHPNIVGVHDRGEADGRLWISMDFVDGKDAAHIVAARYPDGMPAEEVIEIIGALAGALDHAHRQGLLHRDVKPANIMLANPDDDGQRRILLADFGIARTVDDASGLTATNMTIGTVAYCAPEQLMGDPIDGRADQYALAATAYHLLTGSTLFPHTNPAAVIGRHLTAPPPCLSERRPELARADPVMAAALAKDPSDRFARCSDFAQALAEQIGSAPPPTSGPTTPASAWVKPFAVRDGGDVDAAGAETRMRVTGTPRSPAPVTVDPPATSDGASHTKFMVISGGVVVVLVIVMALWWRPWVPAHEQETSTQTSSQTRPDEPALPPPVVAPGPSTTSSAVAPPPSPITTTTQADLYRYALPGCYWGEDPPEERPTVQPFQMCASGSQRLEAMSWSSWGRAGAQGSGIFSFKVCEPSCAEGPRMQYGVNVSAFDPAPAAYDSGCPTDVLFYGEMILTFLGAVPAEYPPNDTYLGKPAFRFTRSPDESGPGFLGNQTCM